MRKSLGSKRRLIPDEARAEIVRIYDEFLNGDAGYGDVSKIFPTTAFGYREIRVERPLRLKVEINMEKVSALTVSMPTFHGSPSLLLKGFLNILKVKDDALTDFLFVWLLDGMGNIWMSRDDFISDLQSDAISAGVKIPAPTLKGLISHFGDTDSDAEICTDARGNPEPDPKLRDHELVPLCEDWETYFEREVLPFVPDAWVDQTYTDPADGEVGRVGYEINFNRYFYQYVPPRPLAEIDAELKALEAEIAGLLKEVVA
jgi:type I restriction enzyme M protein